MKLRIPKELKIGGFYWKVEESLEVGIEGNCYGSLHYTTQTIYLDPRTTLQKKQQAFIHEVLHAIWWQTSLSKTKTLIEEEIIQAVSHMLYQVLLENDLIDNVSE